MNKKLFMILVGIFLFFYSLNYLTPLSFGDDYVYSFIWQGHSEYEPLTEDAVRISSWHDLFVSQWLHYFTWSGRTVNHTLAQFFLWVGKDIFNIFNALISILLVAEIYWYAHKGNISLQFKPGIFCFIFFSLWAFTPGFSPVFFWLDGACNYLWTTVLLLGFLMPYVKKYYFWNMKVANNSWFKYIMLFLGILAGWTNENSICWIIMILFLFAYTNRKKQGMEHWIYTGLVGLIIGYVLLMFAPGNIVRLHAEVGVNSEWLNQKLLEDNFIMMMAVFLFQFLLWYFCIRTLLFFRHNQNLMHGIQSEILLAKIHCIVSFCMSAIMLFSPNFPLRSAFPGTVQLIIAACILIHIQEEHMINIIYANARKLLYYVAIVYFLITSMASFYGFYSYHIQINELLSFIKSTKEKNITVPSLTGAGESINNASGLHLIHYNLSEDENDWRNVAFSRYYGLKGIRMIKEKQERKLKP